jgi:hypothetical protein
MTLKETDITLLSSKQMRESIAAGKAKPPLLVATSEGV